MRGGPDGSAALSRTSRLTPAALAVAAALVAGAGCLGPTEANTARVEIEGEGEGAVFVLTSTRFSIPGTTGDVETPEPSLLSADSAVVEVPFETTADISATNRFLVRARPPDTTEHPSATVPDRVTMRVFVDGERHFDRTADLYRDTLRFRFIAGLP